MKLSTCIHLLGLLLVVLALSPGAAHAQIGKRLKDKVKKEASERAGVDVHSTTRDAADAAEDVQGTAEPEATQNTADAEKASAAPAASLKPGEGAWANYDFVPGERPLFVDDFSEDRVGNFPRRLEFKQGNMEVVEWQGQRFLRISAMSAFQVPLPETLPEKFTIEFDAYNGHGDWIAVMTAPELPDDGPLNYSQYSGSYFLVDGSEPGIEGKGPEAKTYTEVLREGLTPVRITVDGKYAKMYLGEHRVANLPNANIVRGDALHVISWYANADNPTLIGNVRVMAGGLDLYDALEAEGRVATQGILFDTGSDVLRPESTPTLKEIGDALKGNADLRLRIEGHTDNVGNAEANQQLSERRAASVKAYLVSAYGIDAARLEAQGFGATTPVVDNSTPEGRQQNRRVELVKL